jgi:hypothetical protein
MMEASSLLEMASLNALRGTLPNGVPKIDCDVRALMIKRTSLVVTGDMQAPCAATVVAAATHPPNVELFTRFRAL